MSMVKFRDSLLCFPIIDSLVNASVFWDHHTLLELVLVLTQSCELVLQFIHDLVKANSIVISHAIQLMNMLRSIRIGLNLFLVSQPSEVKVLAFSTMLRDCSLKLHFSKTINSDV